ncbi:PTAFR [Mytilus coruscus]|uniref:PTAFR n=1 Tax=Mytilus coruscus TaxID=42192 RepID=A0A6J8D3Q0_MYTCO|nr:PTAFR [Mytilus coruscus]
MALGLEIIYHNILRLMSSQSVEIQYQCMMITHLVCGTIMSACIHVLLISLERLNATFVILKGILTHLTSYKSVILCFILSHFIALLRFGIQTIDGPKPYGSKNTVRSGILVSNDILIIVVLIITCYGVTVYRMINSNKIVPLTATLSATKNADAIRMRKNVVTLGLIMTLAAVVVLMRCIVVTLLYLNKGNGSDINDTAFKIFNNVFLLINPLLDPVIYVLRIKKYREHLRCKCLKRNSDVAS